MRPLKVGLLSLLLSVSLGSVGCAQLTMTRINSAEKKPNNVWVFFTVEDGEEPVAGLEAEDFEIYAIGIGEEEELKRAKLKEIGRDGTFLGEDTARTSEVFGEVADRIDAHSKRFYLLSYCTPARKGKHEVRIEVNLEDGRRGKLTYEFNADGFGPPPQCNPERKPSFDLEDVEPEEGRKKRRNNS